MHYGQAKPQSRHLSQLFCYPSLCIPKWQILFIDDNLKDHEDHFDETKGEVDEEGSLEVHTEVGGESSLNYSAMDSISESVPDRWNQNVDVR